MSIRWYSDIFEECNILKVLVMQKVTKVQFKSLSKHVISIV